MTVTMPGDHNVYLMLWTERQQEALRGNQGPQSRRGVSSAFLRTMEASQHKPAAGLLSRQESGKRRKGGCVGANTPLDINSLLQVRC